MSECTLVRTKAMGAVLQRLNELEAAIRCTASSGKFNETAIRKAVGFALAEYIMDARAEILLRREAPSELASGPQPLPEPPKE